MHEDARSIKIGNIYNVTGRREDYINPMTDGELNWRSICSFDTDSDEALERWHGQDEVSTRRCARIDKEVRWIGS